MLTEKSTLHEHKLKTSHTLWGMGNIRSKKHLEGDMQSYLMQGTRTQVFCSASLLVQKIMP